MSSLAGVFNASSTLFTMDFYRKFRPDASQHRLVWIGRIATGAMVVRPALGADHARGRPGAQLFLQGVQGYLAPPIFVFFFGVFMKRLNARGANWSLLVGFLLGIFRSAWP